MKTLSVVFLMITLIAIFMLDIQETSGMCASDECMIVIEGSASQVCGGCSGIALLQFVQSKATVVSIGSNNMVTIRTASGKIVA